MTTSRREFMKIACGTAAAAATFSAALPWIASTEAAEETGPIAPISFDECQNRTPLVMAQRSALIQSSWQYLQDRIGSVSDATIRQLLKDIYADSTLKLAELDAKERTAVWNALHIEKYTAQNEAGVLPPLPSEMRMKFPYLSAPGSGYGSHHAYPGGLVTHVAANVYITESITQAYEKIYGYKGNRDIALASQLLHDLHKPYVFQWQADGSCRIEQSLAGTGEHHVLSLAELLVRKGPAELIVAQACAHTHPGTASDEAQVVGWLKAASIIAGVNPVNYGLLDKSGRTLPRPTKQEGFICHLCDHDFVLSAPAVQSTLPVMRQIARADYKLSERDLQGKPFNTLRNQVHTELSAMRLHQAYAAQDSNDVRKLMLSVVKPSSRFCSARIPPASK